MHKASYPEGVQQAQTYYRKRSEGYREAGNWEHGSSRIELLVRAYVLHLYDRLVHAGGRTRRHGRLWKGDCDIRLTFVSFNWTRTRKIAHRTRLDVRALVSLCAELGI